MSLKGTVRSVRAAYRTAERESQRRHRELERQRKQYEKMQELERAAYDVDVYENQLQVLLSVHKECGEKVDWMAIASVPEPQEPKKVNIAEDAARRAENEYKPGFLDRTLKREGSKRDSLASAVQEAIGSDEADYRKAYEEWQAAKRDWKESRELALKILSGDLGAMLDATAELEPFSGISELGSKLSFEARVQGVVEATIVAHGDGVIPTEVKTLLQSGKLSTKKMPKGKFNELYQDYLCSCVLRVANELFSILPIEMVFVTVTEMQLNTATGRQEPTPILSVAISRPTLESLNMDRIDPSDSMGNFVHRMNFKKTTGFSAVEKLTPEDLTTP